MKSKTKEEGAQRITLLCSFCWMEPDPIMKVCSPDTKRTWWWVAEVEEVQKLRTMLHYLIQNGVATNAVEGISGIVLPHNKTAATDCLSNLDSPSNGFSTVLGADAELKRGEEGSKMRRAECREKARANNSPNTDWDCYGSSTRRRRRFWNTEKIATSKEVGEGAGDDAIQSDIC